MSNAPAVTLVQSRADLAALCASIKANRVIAVDTEAEGLHPRHGDKTIGLSVYTPSDGRTWYMAWAHGMKPTTGADLDHTPRVGKSGKPLKPKKPTLAIRRAYAEYLYDLHIRPTVQAANVPADWLDDLKAVWREPEMLVMHNAPFDLTHFALLGFPEPRFIYDTQSALSVVNLDWRGNARDGVYPMFKMPDTGQTERGNRQLKWQARLWGLVDATSGIGSLNTAVVRLGEQLRDLSGGVALYDAVTFEDDEDGELTDAAQGELWRLHPADVALYAGEDTRLTYLLYEKIEARLALWKENHLATLFNRITFVTWQMQHGGVHIDFERTDAMIARGQARLDELSAKVREMSGGMIENPNSSKQLLAYFHAIGLDVDSTNKDTLRGIRDVPIVGVIQELRTLTISLNTFLIKWRENAVNSKIYPAYRVGGTVSGRLSSGDDKYGNSQNQPRVSAKAVVNPKSVLCPPEGTLWIDIDYSALEVNVGAWVAETVIGRGQDLTLTKILEAGADMHSVAMERSGIDKILLAGRTEEQYLLDNGYDLAQIEREGMTPKQYFVKKIARQTQKTANFASQYGSGVRGVMKAVGCAEREADIMLRGFHTAFPAIRKAMDACSALALKPRQVAETLVSNFIRYPIPELALTRKFNYYPLEQVTAKGGVWSPRKQAARNAFNSVVQGTGGLIMLASILRIKDKFGFTTPLHANTDLTFTGGLPIDSGNKVSYASGIVTPLLTIHDSISLALRPCDLDIVPEILRLMIDWPTRPVLSAGVSAARLGGTWGDVHDVKDLDVWIKSNGERYE